MDQDLEELLNSFSGYGVESWMKEAYRGALKTSQELREAIRSHRDERGHDRCWEDDQKLYKSLPEGLLSDSTLPPKEEFIKNCERFWEHRKDPSIVYLKQIDLGTDMKGCSSCDDGKLYYTDPESGELMFFDCIECNGTMKKS